MSIANKLKQNMQYIKEQAHMKPEDLINSVNQPSESDIYDLTSKYLGIDINSIANGDVFEDSIDYGNIESYEAGLETNIDSVIGDYTKIFGLEEPQDYNGFGKIITGIPSIDNIDAAKDSQLSELVERGVDSMLQGINNSMADVNGETLTKGLYLVANSLFRSEVPLQEADNVYNNITSRMHGAYDISIDSRVTSGTEWANKFANSSTFGEPIKTAAESSYSEGYISPFQDTQPSSVTIDYLKQLDAANPIAMFDNMSTTAEPNDKVIAEKSDIFSNAMNMDGPAKLDEFNAGIVNMNNSLITSLELTKGVPNAISDFTNNISSDYFGQLLDANKIEYNLNNQLYGMFNKFIRHGGLDVGLIAAL